MITTALSRTISRRVKDHAAKVGIAIDGGMGCICPLSASWNPKDGDPKENILRGLRVAKAVGATFHALLPGQRQRTAAVRFPSTRSWRAPSRCFDRCAPKALDMGVRIALENHAGDMQAKEVRTIIEESGKDAVGSCLDTGNPMWVVEDPLVTLEVLAPLCGDLARARFGSL